MNATQNRTLAALSSALLIVLVAHASNNGSFNEPSTFVGIFVGIVLASTAWAIGARRQRKNREN
jgi:hypothetical protein